MHAPEQLHTQRLRLRKVEPADALAIFNLYGQDTDVTRYLTWQPHQTLADTETFLEFCQKSWSSGSGYPLVIERQSDGQLLGMIEPRPSGHKVEVGYVLGQPYWGQGYMTEALQVIIEWAWQQPELYRFWAVCDVENPGSWRVMEKAGMEREGTLRCLVKHPNIAERPRDCYVYSIVRDE